MKNSSATFNRMMRQLLQGLPCVDSYIDDILIHTGTWEEHILVLTQLLSRIRDAKLTIRPSKCVIGETNVNFLSHIVGDGMIHIHTDNAQKIKEAARPTT